MRLRVFIVLSGLALCTQAFYNMITQERYTGHRPVKGIEATPPLGKPTLSTVLDDGRYYTELYLMLGGRYAVKMRHDFTISQIADGITDIRFN